MVPIFKSFCLFNLVVLLTIWINDTFAYISFHRYHGEEGKTRLSSAKLGAFQIYWDTEDPYVYVIHTDDKEKVLFQTIPSTSFITVGFATDSHPPIVDGNYKVNEWTLFETPYQSIRKVDIRSYEVILSGELWGLVTKASYTLRFYFERNNLNGEINEENDNIKNNGDEILNQIGFDIKVRPLIGNFNRVFLNYWCDTKEKFYGFGSQVRI